MNLQDHLQEAINSTNKIFNEKNDDHDCRNGDPDDGCSVCSESYPHGGMEEPYDSEREYELTKRSEQMGEMKDKNIC